MAGPRPQAGPPLTGLYGRTVALADGKSAIADDAYIRRSIVDPKSEVRAGYPPLMPSYDGKIEPEQIMNSRPNCVPSPMPRGHWQDQASRPRT